MLLTHRNVAQDMRPSGPEQLAPVEKQPEWVGRDATLCPHQLEAVNWLRRNWAAGRCGILADEPGLGRTATVATFLKVHWSHLSSRGHFPLLSLMF
jgi:SNF2 family DNA or RNA helicase